MFNRHKIIGEVKKILFGEIEQYEFAGKKLYFKTGTRPIRRKYKDSKNQVVKNDVLQIELFEKEFGSQDVLWDIGSHHGHYSIFAASIAHGNSQVFSFEPDGTARGIQRENILLNNMNAKIAQHSIAVAGFNGELLFEAKNGNANSHLVKNANDKNPSIIKVIGKTTNSLLDELPSPTFVKIDVEGAEIDILKSSERLLSDKGVRFICELHPFAWDSFGVNYSEFEELINRYDRSIVVIDPELGTSDLPYYGTVLF